MLDLKFSWETLGLLHMREFAESGYAQLHVFPQFLGVGWLIHRLFPTYLGKLYFPAPFL